MQEQGFESEDQQPTQMAGNDCCEQATSPVPTSAEQNSPKPEMDEQHLVLERLLLAHETWFDVTRDCEYAGHVFPGYAEFHSHGEKYVLVKRAKLWEVDAFEYIFFDLVDALTGDQMQEWLSFMTEKALEKVIPEPGHMTSYISLVLVANSVDKSALKPIKTRFHKEFKMGMLGWVDLRIGVIDLKAQKIYTNGMGKEMLPQLGSALGLPAKKKFLRR